MISPKVKTEMSIFVFTSKYERNIPDWISLNASLVMNVVPYDKVSNPSSNWSTNSKCEPRIKRSL